MRTTKGIKEMKISPETQLKLLAYTASRYINQPLEEVMDAYTIAEEYLRNEELEEQEYFYNVVNLHDEYESYDANDLTSSIDGDFRTLMSILNDIKDVTI
jgi:hypothetical protein